MHKHSRHLVDLRNIVPGMHKQTYVKGPSHIANHDVVHPVSNPINQSPISNVGTATQHNQVQTYNTHKNVKSVRKRRIVQNETSFITDVIAQIKSVAQFVTLTAVIFVILFGLSNYSAYKELFSYWYQTEVIQADRLDTAVDDIVKPLDKHNVNNLVLNEGKISYVNFQVRPSDYRIYVPKINKNLPIIETRDDNLIAQNWDSLEEDIQKDLRRGVVHYPGTASPGQKGNVFLTSHSSWYPNDPLPYGMSSAFALLGQLVAGDKVYIFKNGEMYIYKIRDKYVVKPTNVEVLDQPTDRREMTLMTCTPVGTSLNRMIVKLDLIYPTYDSNGSEIETPQINPYLDGRLQS